MPSIGGGGSPPAVGVKAISAGPGTTCGIKEDGSAWCWGNNKSGELGNGTREPSPIPVRVAGITDARAIEVGGTWNYGDGTTFACAVLQSGEARCWGAVPGFDDQLTPVSLAGVGNVRAIAGGNWHACALSTPGLVQCWGSTTFASPSMGETAPRPVPAWGDVAAISGRGTEFTCALSRAGSVSCLGDGYTDDWEAPVTIDGVTSIPDGLSVGPKNSCLVRANGTVACWRSTTSIEVVSGIDSAIGVSVGRSHACAVIQDRTVRCWGGGNYEILGGPELAPITGIRDAATVSAGHSHTCALSRDGAAWCWGYFRNGQLGNGKEGNDSTRTPVRVQGF
jgi:Regulator of chromosome condensation (RCC1) repeat